jgi:uncharacterized protein with ParB-like and HNH nuclease domain
LIYMALYRHAQKQNDQSRVDEIQETYLINKFRPENEKLKLKSTENNRGALNHIMTAIDGQAFDGYSRIVENFNYFQAKINDDNFNQIKNGLSKLIFVDISLDRDKDHPQKIFESLNSLGLKLEQSDLIRNYVFMGLKAEQQQEIHKNYWEHIETLTKDEKNSKSRLSDFIKDYLIIKTGQRIPTEKVYFEFKKTHSFKQQNDLIKTLEELKTFAYAYHQLINPHKESAKLIRTHLTYIKRLDVHVIFPFLMSVYADFFNKRIDMVALISILKTVESFIFRRSMMGLQTNSIEHLFISLYKKIEPENYVASIEKILLQGTGNQRFPSDDEIKKSLKIKAIYKIKNPLYVFERLENFNKEPIDFENNEALSIEHIFPQNPNEAWKAELNKTEYDTIKKQLLHTLGNLTLSANNGELGNKSFTEKKTMNVDGQEQGYQYSHLWLNRDLRNKTSWGKADIEERAERLTERFLLIWPLPNMDVETIANEQELIDIFLADDPTKKKLEYARFFDEDYSYKEVRFCIRALYGTVFKKLFDLHPEAFFSSNLHKKLKVTKMPEEIIKIKSAIPINEFYFIESNMPSTKKFELIKDALTLLDYTDELFIKYAEEV